MEDQSNSDSASTTTLTTATTTGTAQAADEKTLQAKQLVLMRSTANGQSLPVYLGPGQP